MPEFAYKAIDEAGKFLRGRMTAIDETDIEQRIARNGLTLIDARMVRFQARYRKLSGNRIKPRVLIEFYHRLAQTLELGLPIISALEENASQIPSTTLKRVIGETIANLENGNTLYESMKRFPKIFEKLDLAIVMMGEQAGILPKSLKDLSVFLEWKEDIRSTIMRALLYPIFILLTILGVLGVWVGYVLPQLAEVLSEMGVSLPGTTRTVLDTSLFLQDNWLEIVLATAACVICFFLFQKTRSGGILVHRYIMKVPLVGGVFRNIAAARLSHNFAAMYSAGMNINTIFDILKDNVLGNRYFESQLRRVHEEITTGRSLTEGFEAAGGFPPLLVGGIKNGETTGTLDVSLKRLGDYYDGEVKRTVQAMMNAVEPITTLLLGGVFGLIALSILLPLYDVIGQLK